MKISMRKGLLAVMGAYFLSSMSVVIVPFAVNGNGKLTAAGYTAGILFWLGLLAGSGGYVYLYSKNKEKMQGLGRPAVVRFFSGRMGIAADITMIVSLTVSVYCAVKITVNPVVSLVFLFLLVLSVYGHFIFNGKIYRYICQNTKKQQ